MFCARFESGAIRQGHSWLHSPPIFVWHPGTDGAGQGEQLPG